MKANTIPVEVREEALRSIERFNEEELADSGCRYVPRFRGKYLYLDREDDGIVGHICRLEYIRKKRLWEIAIYKYSDDCYDPYEWLFPGNEFVDGTVEGAMNAGMEAYP